ncbi:MAG: hypothetical protein AB7G28_16625 [Pirellulales bacterium]
MKTRSSEFTPVPARRTRRTVPAHFEGPQEHAVPEAFDEIFAQLALKQDRLERANQAALNAEQVRDTTDEMDRQRGRLARLLRDIDLSA